MAAEEMIDATISRLRALALEQYSLIKDILKRPTQSGDADTLANAAGKLAQLEGAMITIQQYKSSFLGSIAQEEVDLARKIAAPTQVEVQEDTDEEEATEADDEGDSAMSEEELLSKSPTYKHSVDVAKLKGLID